MSILEDLTSRDPTRIWKACGAVRELRDKDELRRLADNIDLIRSATKRVKLGGIVRPNSSHLAFSLRKIEFIRDAEGCFCELYMLDDMFDPDLEARAGNITILDTTNTQEGFVDRYRCRCSLCGRIYFAIEREYHYTWWKWEPEENFIRNDS